MTPLQSWGAMLLLFALVCLLLLMVAKANTLLDRWLVAGRPGKSVPLAPIPHAQPVKVMSRDGFLMPASDEIYDYTVHGL